MKQLKGFLVILLLLPLIGFSQHENVPATKAAAGSMSYFDGYQWKGIPTATAKFNTATNQVIIYKSSGVTFNGVSTEITLKRGTTIKSDTTKAGAETVKISKSLTIGAADSSSCIYLWASDSTKYKVRISPSGVLYSTTVTP